MKLARLSSSFFTLAFAALVSSHGFAQGGPPGNYNWIQNPANGHYYARGWPSSPNLTWLDAQSLARSLGPGADLATVRSTQENEWICSTIYGGSPSFLTWIGLNDVATEGVFEWSNGEPVAFTSWRPGEPDGDGDGVALAQDRHWADAPDLTTYDYVLEWIPSYPSLSATGSCPGLMTLTITDATAGRNVAIIYGAAGNFVKSSSPCQGLVLGISRPSLGAILAANSLGVVSLSFNAPPSTCGKTVQAVDLTTCHATNSIVL